MSAIDQRTGLEPIDTAECWRLLRAGRVGRLAVAVGHQLDIFPVNYLVHDGGILVRTAAGTKLAAALFGPSVAFEIDGVDEASESGWSVVAHGRAEEVTRLEASLAAEDSGLRPWADAPKDRWMIVRVDEVTGRRLTPQGHL